MAEMEEHNSESNLNLPSEEMAQHCEDQGVDQSLEPGLDDSEAHEDDPNMLQEFERTVEHDYDTSEDPVQDVSTDQCVEAEQGIDRNIDHDAVDPEVDNLDLGEEPSPNDYDDQDNDQETALSVTERRWPGWPGESVFRMLVPAQKVGGIIGRKGEFIKRIVEETKARIKILDGPPGTSERVVMVSAKEETDSIMPPALDGLMRVHKRVVDGLDGDSPHQYSTPKVATRLLVPASQAGSLIGKQGGTVKSIQEMAGCMVKVLGTEDLPVFALPDDRVVEVTGQPSGVHKAVELIASHLRKFLVDRSIIPMFEIKMANPQIDHLASHQSWGPPQGLAPQSGSGGLGYGHSQYLPPPRPMDSYYAPPDLAPTIDKPPHQGISTYGREAAPVGVHTSSSVQTTPSLITQIAQQMQIPLSYADAVIGTAGASISYIRRASGATVTIQETRGAPGEMTVEISGTASQVQAAQQLIQNFMAEAGAPPQTQTSGATDQGYNPYATHGSLYSSPPSNQTHGGHSGSYGAAYGTNYGY